MLIKVSTFRIQTQSVTMPEQTRQLAAIMFTDIVGYTALMGRDEQKAMQSAGSEPAGTSPEKT